MPNYEKMVVSCLRSACVLFALALATVAHGQDNSFFESFVRNVGRSTFAVAWPTATYDGASFSGTEAGNGVIYAVFRLYGRSAFDGSELWTDCIVTFRGLKVVEVRFGRNNGVVPPGLTAGILTQLLQDMQKGADQAENKGGQIWIVSDKCSDKQGIFIRFFDRRGDLAWPDWKTSYHIDRGKSRTFNLAVKPGQLICYGARPDKDKKKYWGVGINGSASCDSCCYEATATNIPIELTCE